MAPSVPRRLVALLLVLVVASVFVPLTQAHPASPHEIRTGDAHVYVQGQHWEPSTDCYGDDCLPPAVVPCPDAITTWRITLNVTDAASSDVLAFVIESTGTFPGGGAVIGTGQASWVITTSNGCPPLTTVHGVLVEGVASYGLRFEHA